MHVSHRYLPTYLCIITHQSSGMYADCNHAPNNNNNRRASTARQTTPCLLMRAAAIKPPSYQMQRRASGGMGVAWRGADVHVVSSRTCNASSMHAVLAIAP